MNTDLAHVEQLAKLMAEYELTEISIDEKNGTFTMCRGAAAQPCVAPQYAVAPPVGTAAPAGQAEEAASTADAIVAPIVGTFYQAPAPDAPPFVKEGDEVTPDTVVCIIEAMKVMNEVKAERSGRITRVLAENAHAVEFGQPLFEITSA